MPASGLISTVRQRKTDKSPTHYGKLKFPMDFLKEIADWLKARPDIKEVDLELSGWERDGQYGPYISVNAKLPYEPAQPAQSIPSKAQTFSRPALKVVPAPEVEKAPWES